MNGLTRPILHVLISLSTLWALSLRQRNGGEPEKGGEVQCTVEHNFSSGVGVGHLRSSAELLGREGPR